MDPSYDDESQMRSFWKEWNRRVTGANNTTEGGL